MGQVSLKNVVKRYGDKTLAVQGVDLEIKDGEFIVFVGPSGCGKTTLLRMIAGLEEITSGELHIDGRFANHIPPSSRRLAMVFQSYALYPHMTVFDNMAFSLKLAGMKKSEVREAVENTAEILQITHLLKRKPRELSGGERQRVAIGRSIVRKPSVFLFDEPLSNLDASLRVQMRIELTRLHQQLKATMIYVTHDQVEAMTLGQRIVVFNAGKIEQVGSPVDLYENPGNLFVAGFLGAPKMNLFDAEVLSASDNGVTIRTSGGAVLDVAASGSTLKVGGRVTLGIRPEHVQPGASRADERNVVVATANVIEHLGDVSVIYATAEGASGMIAFKQNAGQSLPVPGADIALHFPSQACYLFDHEGKTMERTSGRPERREPAREVDTSS